jgi:hypothetical protein
VTLKCNNTILYGFLAMQDIRNNSARRGDWNALGQAFNTCKPITSQADIDNLYLHLMNGYSYMAMTNYPYPTSFLTPMPAWPVNASCKYFENITSEYEETDASPVGGISNKELEAFTAMLKAVNVYFNNDSANPNCTDFSDTDATGDLDGFGWNVLACNQMAMPTSNGPHSMFIPQPWDYEAYTQFCQQTYKLSPRYDWVWDYFGGKDIQRDFLSISNIIFSNGQLDPWRAGGLTTPIAGNSDIHLIYIENAAHHLDLREPNDAYDPDTVKAARAKELEIIRGWVNQYMGTA